MLLFSPKSHNFIHTDPYRPKVHTLFITLPLSSFFTLFGWNFFLFVTSLALFVYCIYVCIYSVSSSVPSVKFYSFWLSSGTAPSDHFLGSKLKLKKPSNTYMSTRMKVEGSFLHNVWHPFAVTGYCGHFFFKF